MGRILLLLFCSIICSVSSIDIDYYLGVMRSLDCIGQNADCSKYCNGPSVCHKSECYCHHSTVDKVVGAQTRKQEGSYRGEEVDVSSSIITAEAVERPALRHHIAHFCPNLNVARTCIRKCMKLGKPAFCGKDHKCYCGHKHNPHSKDKAADAKESYADFKDLYEKYFGKQPSREDHIVEAN